MSAIHHPGYFEGGNPSEEAGQTCLQSLIDIQLLKEACSQEERQVIFGKF